MTVTIACENDQREQLEQELEKYFQVFATASSDLALQEVKKRKHIKFGIIDQRLEKDQTRQSFQELDVIERLGKDRPDMRFIVLTSQIITDANQNQDTIEAIARIIDEYLDHDNVIDVIHKQLYYQDKFGKYRGTLYNRIIDQIKLLIKAGDLR